MIKIGIIGAGRIGKVHCESIMSYVKGATVKTVADPERRRIHDQRL